MKNSYYILNYYITIQIAPANKLFVNSRRIKIKIISYIINVTYAIILPIFALLTSASSLVGSQECY